MSSLHLVENIRNSDAIAESASILSAECKSYKFGLENSFCDANDILIATKSFWKSPPIQFMSFCEKFFGKKRFDRGHCKTRCFMLFQIFYVALNKNNKTPLHIGLAQTIHSICRSRKLLTILNSLGLCSSYQTVQHVDAGLTNRTLSQMDDSKRIPISSRILDSMPLHAAIDNFDWNENTKHGKGGSHDTVMIIIQNIQFSHVIPQSLEMSVIPEDIPVGRRTTFDITKYHEYSKLGRYNPNILYPGEVSKLNFDKSLMQNVQKEFFFWCLARHAARSAQQLTNSDCLHLLDHDYEESCDSHSTPTSLLPSYTATQSAIIKPDEIKFHRTVISFAPILPYPPTDHDIVYTRMLQFSDALVQKKTKCGSFWCDMAIYKIAKEIQILKPDLFGHMFIGIGGFHHEKILMAVIGKILQCSGIENVLVETEVYGPSAVKQVLDGGHYSRSKRGLALIAESFEAVRLIAYQQTPGAGTNFEDIQDGLNLFQSTFTVEKHHVHPSILSNAWKESKSNLEESAFLVHFTEFVARGNLVSKILRIGASFWMKYTLFCVT